MPACCYQSHWLLHSCLPLLSVHWSEPCCIQIHWYLHSMSSWCLPLPSVCFKAQHHLSRSFQVHMPLQRPFSCSLLSSFFLPFFQKPRQKTADCRDVIEYFSTLIFVKIKILAVHKHILLYFLIILLFSFRAVLSPSSLFLPFFV